MNRFSWYLVPLLMAFCVAAPNAEAAAFGSSLLKINNFRLQKKVGSSWVNATAAQATTVFNTGSSSTSVFLEPNLSDSTFNLSSYDTLQAFVSPSLAPPGENSFTSFGNPLAASYARSDTGGSGVDLIGAGISTQSISEVSSITSLGGFANGRTRGDGSFTIKVSQSGTYRIAFGAQLDMVTTNNGIATSTFQLTIDNLAAMTSDPVAFNSLNRSQTGNSTYNYANANLASDAKPFVAGTTHDFSFTQLTGSSVPLVQAVPEPTSLAVFGLLGVGAMVARRRVRRS